MKVINLFAGPGAGKSTTAAGLFFLMKLKGYKVELIIEYAKELVYNEDWETLANQELVTKEQNRRQERLLGKVDYAITDSPLLLGLIYGQNLSDDLKNKILGYFNYYENINFFKARLKPYAQYGRNQNEEEAKEKDREIGALLAAHDIKYNLLVADDKDAPQTILDMLESGLV